MKPALVVVCVTSLCWLGCKDIPQAPLEVGPTVPSHNRILIDSQFYADYAPAIVYPSLVVSGPTTFGLTYRLWEAGRYRFAGCPIACEERRNWVVGDPDPTPGDRGDAGASAAVDDRMQTAYQLWSGYSPALKYASCIALCQQSSAWSVTNVDTTAASGFFVSLAARFGAAHIAYVRLDQSPADTGLGLRYAVCSNGCTTMDAWIKARVDTDAYGKTQVAIDPAGVVHIVYQRGYFGPVLKYARCTTACTTTTSWQLSTIGAGENQSLAVDASANLIVAYTDTTDHSIQVAICAAGCASGNWTTGVVATPESWVHDVALTVAPSGKLYMAYGTTTTEPTPETEYGMVRLGSCTSACSVAANWQFVTVDSTNRYHPWVVSLALDSAGNAGIAHANSYGMYFTLVKELP